MSVYLEGLAAIKLVPDALANNFSGVHDILQNSFLDGCEGPGSWAGALLLSRAVDRFRQNSAVSNDDNVTATAKMIHIIANIV